MVVDILGAQVNLRASYVSRCFYLFSLYFDSMRISDNVTVDIGAWMYRSWPLSMSKHKPLKNNLFSPS